MVHPQPHLEREGGADTLLGCQADVPLHAQAETAADRQSKSGASVATGHRGVGLAEGTEKQVKAIGGDADAAVAHLEIENEGFALARGGGQRLTAHRHHHRAGWRELHRIAEQVP